MEIKSIAAKIRLSRDINTVTEYRQNSQVALIYDAVLLLSNPILIAVCRQQVGTSALRTPGHMSSMSFVKGT